MNELQAALKIAMANMYVMYMKAHSYHWNVEGMFFAQFHEFFGDLYQEVYGAIDPMAEQIRAIDTYAPISLADVLSACTCEEDTTRPTELREMIARLMIVNNTTLESLNKAFDLAAGNNGLQNFLADRVDQHSKHAWMLRATLKNLGA